MSSRIFNRTGLRRIATAVALCMALPASLSAQELAPGVTLKGHTGQIYALAFDPDGKTLASGSADGAIKLWDLVTGKNIATLKNAADDWNAYDFGTGSLAFSPDGKTLASANGCRIIKLWDLATGKSTTIKDEIALSTSQMIRFSPDGKTLASAPIGKRGIKLWNVATGKIAGTLNGPEDESLGDMAFTPDSKTVVSVSKSGRLALWDVSTGKNTKMEQDGSVSLLGLSRDGKAVAIEEDERVKLREPATGKEIATLQGPAWEICSVVFSPNGNTAISLNFHNTLILWNVASGKELARRPWRSYAELLTFSPDGKSLAFVSMDKEIKLWDLIKEPRLEEERAIQALKEIGGGVEIKRDDTRPGKPAIELTIMTIEAVDADFKVVAALKQLQTLEVFSCPLRVTDVGMKELVGLKELQTLRLESCGLTDEGMNSLAGLTKMRKLEIAYARVTSEGLKNLTAMKDLQELDLTSNHDVTDAGLKHLAVLKSLQVLRLFNTQVSDEGMKELAGLTRMRDLDLSDTKVTDLGLKQLAGMKQLQSLQLRSLDVTDEGLKVVKGMTELKELGLSGTKITDAGLKELAGLKQLETLYLNQTKTTEAGVAELKKALPKCTISR